MGEEAEHYVRVRRAPPDLAQVPRGVVLLPLHEMRCWGRADCVRQIKLALNGTGGYTLGPVGDAPSLSEARARARCRSATDVTVWRCPAQGLLTVDTSET